MSGAAVLGSLRLALCVFTVLPVPGPTGHRLERVQVLRAMPWLPVVGALVGAAGAATYAVVAWFAHGDLGRLLAAALSVAVPAVLTGLLHLDGLADTADGLGSRQPPERALQVMRASDIGPMGVVTLILVLLVQVASVAAIGSVGAAGAAGSAGMAGAGVAGGVAYAAVALVLASVVARTAVVLAAVRGVPGARGEGFGALVADGVPRRTCIGLVCVVAAMAAGGGTVLGGWQVGLALLGAVAVGLLAADRVRQLARRRLGGMTGDVFGAVVETATTAALLTVALTTPPLVTG